MEVPYIPGPKNIVADSLSRGPIQHKHIGELEASTTLAGPDIGIGIAALLTEKEVEMRFSSPAVMNIPAENLSGVERPADASLPRVMRIEEDPTTSQSIKQLQRQDDKLSTIIAQLDTPGDRIAAKERNSLNEEGILLYENKKLSAA